MQGGAPVIGMKPPGRLRLIVRHVFNLHRTHERRYGTRVEPVMEQGKSRPRTGGRWVENTFIAGATCRGGYLLAGREIVVAEVFGGEPPVKGDSRVREVEYLFETHLDMQQIAR